MGTSGACDVYAEGIDASLGKQIVPVYIRGNNNLIAFKIHMEFDSQKVRVLKVKKGEITKKGNLINNIGLEAGKIDVIWNTATGVCGDGSLFILEIEPIADEFTIKLSYDESNTFDDNFAFVSLNCFDIVSKQINAGETSDLPESQLIRSDNKDSEKRTKLSETEIEPVITKVLEEIGVESLNDILASDKELIVTKVNGEFTRIFGVDAYYGSCDNIIDDYRGALAQTMPNEISNVISDESPQEIIEDYLMEKGERKVTDDNVTELNEIFEGKGLDKAYGKYLEKDALADVYNLILNSEQNNDESELDSLSANTSSAPLSFKRYRFIIYTIVDAALITVAVVIFIKRRRKR